MKSTTEHVSKIDTINKAFYTNAYLKGANTFPVFISVLLFLLMVTFLGLGNAYAQNRDLNATYQLHQEEVQDTLLSAYETVQECSIDTNLHFVCDLQEEIDVGDTQIVFDDEIGADAKYAVAFYEQELIVITPNFQMAGPYALSQDLAQLDDNELQSYVIAQIATMMQFEETNTSLDELTYALLVLTINILLVASITSMDFRKVQKLKVKRKEVFNHLIIIALPIALLSCLITILLPQYYINGSIIFVLLYNIRLYFYVKVFKASFH